MLALRTPLSAKGPMQRLVVTGANGWLGRNALRLAKLKWGDAVGARVLAYGSRAGRLDVDGIAVEVHPLDAIGDVDLDSAMVLHFAFLTKDRLDSFSHDDYIAGNLRIDAAVMDACRRSPPAGVFVASSGAAALVQKGRGDLYGVLKLVQEQRFTQLRADLQIPVLIGRIWSLAGPYINKPNAYAISAFLLQGRREGRITVGARIPVYRSYVHAQDLVEVVLATMAAPDNVPEEVVDLAGSEVVEMIDVAMAASRALGLDASAIHRDALALDRRSVYVGDPTPFRDLALAIGAYPRPFAQQVEDTLAYLDAAEVAPMVSYTP